MDPDPHVLNVKRNNKNTRQNAPEKGQGFKAGADANERPRGAFIVKTAISVMAGLSHPDKECSTK
ncbi:hypothetical protein UF64_06620 [Thalassospira sp. HJ]|nr:hypothetical protein UF64_06620 [Thalassospira sp. HJ]